jgi:hypothetical protein
MDPNFKTTSLPAITRFRWVDVDPPSSLYLLRDDILFMQGINANPLASEVLQFFYRFLRTPEVQGGQPSDLATPGGARHVVDYGIIESGLDGVFPGPGPSAASTTRTLGEGYLLSMAVNCGGNGLRGATFARVAILRGGNTLQFAAQVLLADYVTLFAPIGWPGARILHPSEGPGWRHSVQVANPVAGADWAMTIGAFTRRSVISFSATFTASAAVASRNITIIVDDATNTLWQDDVSVAVTASQTASINGAQTNVPVGVIATTLFVTLPPGMILPPTFRLRASTANIQAADQWSNIWFQVEDWLEQR